MANIATVYRTSPSQVNARAMIGRHARVNVLERSMAYLHPRLYCHGNDVTSVPCVRSSVKFTSFLHGGCIFHQVHIPFTPSNIIPLNLNQFHLPLLISQWVYPTVTLSANGTIFLLSQLTPELMGLLNIERLQIQLLINIYISTTHKIQHVVNKL